MTEYGIQDNQEKALHPGSRIKQELKSLGLTQKNAAAIPDMQPLHLSEIVRGKRNVTKAAAIRLQSLFPIPAGEWMLLQTALWRRLKDLAR